ncbi:MAG: radical SAM protein [candidate division WOR-3 bacterium]|nr:radical SAM protein [candidate division WOR-3 bacterium]
MAEIKEKNIFNSDIVAKIMYYLLNSVRTRFIINSIYKLAKPKLIRDNAQNPLYAKSHRIAEELYYLVEGMLNITNRAHITQKTLNIFLKAIFLNQDLKRITKEWLEKYGYGPPGFLVLSPTKQCNLQCPNCYANSAGERDKLPYSVVKRIISEAYHLWGNRFFVISGGEPLIYKSDNKSILNLAEEFPDSIFLMYTNGLMINPTIAQKLAELGNLTPAISVEGMKETTDRRRGLGTFDKIIKIMEMLRQNRVLFGISITATRENCEEVLSDEFIDFFFDKMGAGYGWIFHYMPIGRDVSVDFMPTPKQRVWMWQRSWEIIKKKKVFLVDFWNHGSASSGCIAGGREGGYLHINWHGDVAPCVFFPYAVSNIKTIFENGGNLNDAIQTPFFQAIRDWQCHYGYPRSKDIDIHSSFNWLRPCIIRDHFQEAFSIIKKYKARALDYAPDCIYLENKNYFDTLQKYDQELKALVDPLWQKLYQNSKN